MSNTAAEVIIEFAEVMSGYVSAEAVTFADGYADGEKTGTIMALHVTVTIPNLDAFLSSPEHAGSLSGHVDCALLGGVCPVQSGVFRLLPDTADLDRKVMYYQVYATTPKGEQITFVGQKEVQHNAPLDLWRDTTTLFTNVYRGHIDPAKAAQQDIWLTGILSLGLMDFMRVLRGLKATDANGQTSVEGLARFGVFFAGKLWEVYGPHLPPAINEPKRRYALFTTEGVTGADITVHPFSTADGLGLTLTRFCRAPSDDVVLVVHGLTNSSDMFIMPEHKNLVQTLLDEGFSDVWAVDFRGSNRFPYNLGRNRYTLDDMALFDHPAALAELRRRIGPNRRIHVVAHCVGALSMAMSVFGKTVQGIRSMILNSVALAPYVSPWARLKISVGPWAADYLLGIEYFNPKWRREPRFSIGSAMACVTDLIHTECDSPECHMLSFMWGSGRPSIYNHENMAKETHDRLGDLFGGAPVHYYYHIKKMIDSGNTAVKYDPGNPRYAALPDNYFEHAKDIQTPILLTQGQDNRVFVDANIRCHERLEKIVPGRHQLHVYPKYGHQDIFMGKNAATDIFPRMIQFLKGHCHD
ncbi:MAG: alpha/beta fold hydrolase [Burkholderiales bacterium]|nr:alpha/beta fold hydrolase [Burkholderiales bacterium]